MSPTTTPPHKGGPRLDQTNHLVGWALIWAVVALNITNGVAFMDIMGVPSLLPSIAMHFHAANTITWAATAGLASATVGQCISGYLSDIFGRKRILMLMQVLLMVSSVACGFCSFGDKAAPFYGFRALAGIATGSISNLVNVTQSDICTAKQRANLQGVQGCSVALGSAAGLLIAAALVQKDRSSLATWQFLYYIEFFLAALAMVAVHMWVPSTKLPSGDERWRCIKTIDWIGIGLGSLAIVLALVVITMGSKFGWTSPKSIVIGALSGMFCIAYLIVGFWQPQKRFGVRPIVPFHLFGNRTIRMVYLQNLLIGAAYYSFIVFMPMYWHFIMGFSQLEAAALMLPYLATHAFWSTASAWLIRRNTERSPDRRNFTWYFFSSFAVWCAAMMILAFVKHLGVVKLVVLEVMVGFGTGGVFQNSVNAIRVQVEAEESAVALGTRNVLRFMGGAIGTAVCSTIVETVHRSHLPSRLQYLANSTFTKTDASTLPKADRLLEQAAYRAALQWSFVVAGGLLGVCFFLVFFIQDPSPEKKPKEESTEKDIEMSAGMSLSSGGSISDKSMVNLSVTAVSSRCGSSVNLLETQPPAMSDSAEELVAVRRESPSSP